MLDTKKWQELDLGFTSYW